MKFRVLFLLILISGCVVEEKVKTVDRIYYICPNGEIVSDFSNCNLDRKTEIVLRYVCPDGSIKNKSEDCSVLEPTIVRIIRYVCLDGSIVNDSEECIPTTSSTTSSITSTSTSTTVLTTISSTTPTSTTSTSTISSCESLGCPIGTKFVASKKSDKYHRCDCRYAKRIKPENLVCFHSREDAEKEGYLPCSVCI